MLQYLYKILFHLNDTVSIFVLIMSVVSGCELLFDKVKKRGQDKKHTKPKWFWRGLLVVSIIVLLGSGVKRFLREVPNVVRYTYQSAYEVLTENDLKCSSVDDKNAYIVEQNPIAGSIVRKGTVIQLIAEPIESEDTVKMVEVPDVIGRTYQDACNTLSRVNLKYNLEIDNGIYVVEQDPIAGTIVEEGTKINLSIEPIGSNPEAREKWENGLGTEFGDVAITFKEIMLQVSKDGMTTERHGPQIIKYEVINASLLDQTSGSEYRDYVIENDVMIFKHIPQGIEFHLTVLLSGYEEANADITLSSQNMIDNTFNLNYWVVNSKAELMLDTVFYIADGDNSTRSNVVYLNNVNLEIKWPYQTYWWVGYSTNSRGCLNQTISLTKEYALQVRVADPFGDGHDYECTVNIYPQKIGEAIDYDILFLHRDGSYESIRAGDYFLHSLGSGDTFMETQEGVTLQ